MTQPTPERTDRYARALYTADHPRGTWEHRPPEEHEAYRVRARAAITEADTETEQLREEARKARRAADLLAGSHRRAEKAEAAITRVRALAEEHIVAIDTALVREALDSPSAANRPGSTVEQLPDHILVLLVPKPYTSTACETAERLEDLAESAKLGGHEELRCEVEGWAQRLYGRCRLNHKFTGELCASPSHRQAGDPGATGEAS